MTQMHSHPRITHDSHRSCIAYVLENMSSICWYRPWYAARLCFGSASGLLRLEELVRRFLISRETLSIRMLDDNLDPTPLLKEIRDDKVATIIIDANASVSYLILKKVRSRTSIRPSEPPTSAGCEVTWVWSTHSSTLGFELFSLTFPFGKESGYSREGCAELTICRIIKQLSQSPTGCTFVVLTELTCIFLPSLPSRAAQGTIFIRSCQQQWRTLLRKSLTKEHFAGMRCRCYTGLFWFMVRPVMPIASAVSHSLNAYGMFSLGILERLSALSEMS